jgi:uncharacterized protein
VTSAEILAAAKVIAVPGLSANPSRISYGVIERMQHVGYTIIPVNPSIEEWNGVTSYPSVSAIPEDIQIDIVDVFRREEYLLETIKDALSRKRLPKCIWLQEGLYCEEGRALCEAAGVVYIEDACIAVEYALSGLAHKQK